MSLSPENATATETEVLRKENNALKVRLARLTEAIISISDNLDTEGVLQDVIDSARELTHARYGALLTFHPSGGIHHFYTCGLSQEEREAITQPPQGLGLLGFINRAKGPVRLKDIATHPEAVGLPENHPPMKTFLGMPIYHRSEHVGNLYLTEKEGEQEFTQEDEDVAAMIAAQAASVVSNFRRYEAEHRAKADLETLMEICPIAVSVFDARLGVISYMNQESRRILRAVAPLSDDLDDIFQSLKFTRPDGREVSFEDLPGTRALQSGETTIAEEIVVHLPDGKTLTTLTNCAPIFSGSGEIVSVLTVMQDMTPLEQQERRRAEFLGKVSEELRTPLTTIKGSVFALRSILEAMYPSEPMQLLRIIDQQTDLMRSQINSLIELTQIETGTLSVITEPADVRRLIELSCGEYLRHHAEITIQLDIAEGLAMVLADRQRISKVLHSFLRQAARYSSELSQVTVSASMVDIYVAISVSVEGRFAPPERVSFPINATEHAKVFKKATQAHTKAAELVSQRDGLAMAFCRGVVEAHGGRIRTEVDEQKGRLSLTFTLPSVEEGEIISAATAEISGESLPVSPKRTRILVAIEDPRLLGTVRKVLHNAGYGAVLSTGLHDVEQLASSEGAELIVLDIAGREEECFRILRRAGKSLHVPAIVLCERDDENYVVRAFEMGADGYMVKPFSPTELVARIRATLRRTTGGRESDESETFQLGDVLINFDERTVYVSSQPIQLTATEYRLLTELANTAGKVLIQDRLLHRVWGPEYTGDPQLLRSYIKSLRQKLGDNARSPKYIFTEHGIGYRMAKPSPRARHRVLGSP